jgi:hypothetical protein
MYGIGQVSEYQIFFIKQYRPDRQFLVLLLHLGCTSNQRSIPFGYLLHLLVQGHKCPLVCFVEFLRFLPGMPKNQETGTGTVEEGDGVGDKGSADTQCLM